MRIQTLVISTLLVAAPLYGQQGSAVKTPAFDVVSIKPAAFPNEYFFSGVLAGGGMCGAPRMSISGNRMTLPIVTLCGLVRVAYDVREEQVVNVPASLTRREQASFFEIDARSGGAAPLTQAVAREMLQSMLADRFQLKVHREPKDVPVYALTAGRGRPKLTERGEIPCPIPNGSTVFGRGRFASCKAETSMAQLAQTLSRETDRPVLDRTGLSGKYAFELAWLPDGAEAQPDSPPSLFTAVQEQLGLKLEPQRAPVDAVVIDHAERPSPN